MLGCYLDSTNYCCSYSACIVDADLSSHCHKQIGTIFEVKIDSDINSLVKKVIVWELNRVH